MFEFYANYIDGKKEKIDIVTEPFSLGINYLLNEELDYTKVQSVDVLLNDFKIKAEDNGYYVLPGGNGKCTLRECAIGYFKNRCDTEYINVDSFMPVLGLNHTTKSFLAAVIGMPESCSQMVKIKDGEYQLFFRIELNCTVPYEKIQVTEFFLPKDDASYSAMARAYRNYKLQNGFVSIKDRINPTLKYAAESVLVRIRMGWKPVPCEILEQTLENEPDMHVACTFETVEKIVKEFKNAGVKKAEFSLVGWNVKGHDGRWPQVFPVEESLGGEEGLKKLIKTVKEAGYTITCHTNSTDAYSIAENFDINNIAVDKNGELDVEAEKWAGGRTYNICPKCAYEIWTDTLPKISELGFSGPHYVDVITATPPRECHSKAHPVNKKEGVAYFDNMLKTIDDLFGGSASEGAYEYNLKNCDFVLYTSFMGEAQEHDVIDEYIPFWQLVYHGIVISNPYSAAINSIINKDGKRTLKVVEFGGRPVLYYYSHFMPKGRNWMGDSDFTADNDEEIKANAMLAKKQEDMFCELSHLQYEFMEEHKKVADGMYEITYSDNTVVKVDYNKCTYEITR